MNLSLPMDILVQIHCSLFVCNHVDCWHYRFSSETFRLSRMETQRASSSTKIPVYVSSESLGNIVNQQWHSIPLLPEGPVFIVEIYKAQLLTSAIVKKTEYQREIIKQARPTVKPLMKRRLSRTGKTPEEQAAENPMPVLEPSLPVSEPLMPVLEPSPPVSSETITLYSGVTDNFPKLQNITKLTAPPSMNANASTCHPSTSNLSNPPPSATNVSPTSSIFDPEPTITIGSRTPPSHSPIAKKSTTPRRQISFKDKIEAIESQQLTYCRVVLYDFAKDYGDAIKFNDWNPNLSASKNTEIGINCNMKEKRKRKLKDSKLKQSPPDSSQKKKREVSRNCDQPIAKKVKASDSLEKPAQANSVPKLRIALKLKLDDPVRISSVGEKPNNCDSFSNKENIISAEVESKQVRKRIEPTPAPPGKKVIDLKNVTCSTEIQAEEISKSDNVLVIRIPQTSSSIEKEQTSKDDPAVPVRDSNPHSATQVKDKPVISLKAYQARRKSDNISSSSSPTHPGTDSVNGSNTTSKQSGHSSPSSTPEGNEPSLSHKTKPLPTSKDSTPKCNGITSSNSSWHFPSELKHKLVSQATPQDAPKKTKIAASIDSSTPIVGNTEQTSIKNVELQSPSPAATASPLKFAPVSLKMHNRPDPRRKLFLSTLAENNNNPNCVGFENSTSLSIDSTATAELDVTSGRLIPLLRQRNQPKLSLVTWKGPNAYRCMCEGTFSLYKEWAEHCRSCIKLNNSVEVVQK
uniref:Uncharacterized protein n=2 Tax=Lygus hesperus TaxID=30085 RepID=A0A146MFG0_LYGHE